jgi:hypothetical protein
VALRHGIRENHRVKALVRRDRRSTSVGTSIGTQPNAMIF